MEDCHIYGQVSQTCLTINQLLLRKTFKKDWKDIKMFENGGTECYTLTCPENYIVVFRGTEPTSWEDIKADIQFRKDGGIHRGFKAALDDIWEDLNETLRQEAQRQTTTCNRS